MLQADRGIGKEQREREDTTTYRHQIGRAEDEVTASGYRKQGVAERSLRPAGDSRADMQGDSDRQTLHVWAMLGNPIIPQTTSPEQEA